MFDVTTIDCHYLGQPEFAAAYLLREGSRAAFIETNTNHAVPRLLDALKEAGLEPAQVDYVIVTHAHLDHAGGAAALMQACPNATLLAHPRAHPHLVDPSKLVASAKQVYGEARFAELYGEIGPIDIARTRVMKDGEVLGWLGRKLTFMHTRGHANHHFCVHDSRSEGVFTGDSFGLVYPALQAPGRVLAVPSTSPTDFDADAAREALARITGTGAKRVYLTHFGVREDLDDIARTLDDQLQRYGAIVSEALDQDIPDEQLDEFCAERVDTIFDQLLAEHGLTNDEGVRALLGVDSDLNTQGVAFAVRKQRFRMARTIPDS